ASSGALAQFLLAPRSLAIVGQSNDAGKTAGRPLKYLRQAGYARRLYPINPGRETVLGERAWPSLAALPPVPEHVYVVTPTDPSVDAVADAGGLGGRVATRPPAGARQAGRPPRPAIPPAGRRTSPPGRARSASPGSPAPRTQRPSRSSSSHRLIALKNSRNPAPMPTPSPMSVNRGLVPNQPSRKYPPIVAPAVATTSVMPTVASPPSARHGDG